MQEKSLRLAIQLNLIFPGIGYFYIGKGIIGIVAILLAVGVYLSTDFARLFQTYLVMNAIMAIHLLIWNSRNKKKPVAEYGSSSAVSPGSTAPPQG